jgi:anti-sigma factor RsiW
MAHEASNSAKKEITCREVVEWTSAYLDEHVGDDRNQEIALHLAVCAGCEAYVKQIVSVRDLVRLLPQAADQPDESARARRAVATKLRRQ